APMFAPIPIGEPTEITHSGLRYRHRVSDEDPGILIQDRWVKEEWTPFVTYTLSPASIEARAAGYQKHHVWGSPSFVLTTLRLVHCEDDRVVQLLNHELITYTDEGKTVEEVYGARRYRELIAEVFGLPNAPVDQALATWSRLNDTKI